VREQETGRAGRTILFVGGSIMPFCRFRQALIRQLVRDQGCRVICAYWGEAEDSLFQPFEMEGVTWIDLGGDHATPPGPGDLRVMARLGRVIRKTRPEVICCFNAKPIVLVPTMARALRPKTRIVALMEGLGTALSFLLDERTGTKQRIFRRMTRAVDHWVLLNPRDAGLIARLHPGGAVSQLPGIGIDIARFRPGPNPLAARRLIFVGRLVPEKGIAFVIDLARMLKGQGQDWHLSIAGLPVAHGGIAPEEIRAWQAEGLIDSCAPVMEMPDFYRDASILLFPSTYQEGLPAVIMEAQASGLPCLVHDMPAVRGAIIDGETGFLLPGDDPAPWVARLKDLSDPARFAAFSKAARLFACENYDEIRTNARLVAILLAGKD
jgi:glycosyltransferase involved in cell wall biosynthesis